MRFLALFSSLRKGGALAASAFLAVLGLAAYVSLDSISAPKVAAADSSNSCSATAEQDETEVLFVGCEGFF